MHDDTMKEETLIQNLTDAGMCSEDIEKFLSCYRENRQAAQMQLLNEYRGKLLSTVQEKQENLYCLDYLIRRMKNERSIKNDRKMG